MRTGVLKIFLLKNLYIIDEAGIDTQVYRIHLIYILLNITRVLRKVISHIKSIAIILSLMPSIRFLMSFSYIPLIEIVFNVALLLLLRKGEMPSLFTANSNNILATTYISGVMCLFLRVEQFIYSPILWHL